MTRRPRDVRLAGLLAVVAAGTLPAACATAEDEPPPTVGAPRHAEPSETGVLPGDSAAVPEVGPPAGLPRGGKPATGPVAEVRALFEDVRGTVRTSAAWEAFLDAFVRADWTEFDLDADEELLRDGCFRSANRALVTGDAATAVRAMEFYEARFREDGRGVVAGRLPAAYALAGDFVRAKRRLDEFTRHADAGVAAWAWVHLGDTHQAQGGIEAARRAWEATKTTPESPAPGGSPNLARRAAEWRLRSVGRPVPSLEEEGGGPSEWIVGGPFAAGALKSRVAVILPFDTSCPQCRLMLHGLQRLHEDRADRGLIVLGLLRPEQKSALPRPGARDLGDDCDRVTVPADGMREHVAAFARNAGLTFPLGLVSVRTWSRWALLGWHPILVVGPEGNVEFLTAGGDTLGLVRVTVDRLLAAQRK